MDNRLLEDIRQSGFIHRPLPLYAERSLESKQQNEPVLGKLELALFEDDGKWLHQGARSMSIVPGQHLAISSPTRMPRWPEGSPEDGDYVNFGSAWLIRRFDHDNWEGYNRITVEVYPDFPGVPNAYVALKFKNEGEVAVPDIYNREGYHGVNVKNGQWNTIHLDIQQLPRDGITELAIGYYLNGKDRATGDRMELRLRSARLERVEGHEISKGWMPKAGDLIYSHSGYNAEGTKTAFAASGLTGEASPESFSLKREGTDEIAFEGMVMPLATSLGTYLSMDFTAFSESGRYYLQAGGLRSEGFAIGSASEVWHASVWKALNFIFCERCGYPVPGIHGSCHADIVARHEGLILSFNGGWHDAGDVSQQLIQTAEVAFALFELAEKVEAFDRDLCLRLIEEGEWGLDFLLKTRFGDGYRATSAGITRWTDGLIGNMDDAEARVHNQAYENFYCAGIEAYIHERLKKVNPALSERLLQFAKEDFEFAMTEYGRIGFDQKPIFWEHTYQTSESLYMATASWAASMLYKATQERQYASRAVEFMSYVLDCQELTGITLDSGKTLAGFFYRNPEKRVVQHFNHQAREHLYLMALAAIRDTQPEHADAESWLASIRSYGDYLKILAAYTEPYPMIASGVYHESEHLDERSFGHQHLLTDERAKADYGEQLRRGEKLNDSYYLRRFPVWFSFRGNNAILLSTGKAASVAAACLNDRELKGIAEGQLQWIAGMNPFAQSLMHGEGYRYAQQYSVLCGEMTGEIPVGIQTWGNDDEPYWPQFNNATYKEVWTGNAGKWLSIVADLYESENGKLG
ncbi:glycoside hydrolase family 9 protein [Paenibacillus sp. FJAT-27812]|uniref:glycoside hydrolase family 9 protein n=1 Tax=Paenibacillus sp. FJAT-27812 TaxID=1684143 RepID=UPI0006A76E3F|nr:glycoside hydrolase family 9 protein [Paenibacillus sp. FJAT-27812]